MLLIGMLIAISSAYSQSNSKLPEQIFFAGRVIRIRMLPGGGFGYDIFQQNQLMIHQDRNPVTGAAKGLNNADDALKAAKWQCLQLGPLNHSVAPIQRSIPKEVATQLKIDTK